MTWTTIAQSETDVNSPLNQTLMDKVRGNLDHVERSSIKGGQTGWVLGNVAVAADRVYAVKFVPPQDCRINSLLLKFGDSAQSPNILGAIYDDNSGAPGDLLTESGTPASLTGNTDDYNDFVLSLDTTINLTGGTPYWFAFLSDTACALCGPSPSANIAAAAYVDSAYSAGFPDPFGSPTAAQIFFGLVA
jgi:hypothetical protein